MASQEWVELLRQGRAFLAGTLETYLIICTYRLERPSETGGC